MTRPGAVLSWPPVTIRVGAVSAPLLAQAIQWYEDHFSVTPADAGVHDVTGVEDDGSPDAVMPLVRRIRAVASAALYEHGWVPLHASAVVDPAGRTLVLFGPSGSGKTTGLLSLLRAGAGDLLGNDRVFLRGTEARGLPVSVGIRPDTARRFLPHIGQRIPGDRRLHVPPRDLAGMFRAGVTRQGTVSALVRIKFDPTASGCALRRLGRAEAGPLIAESRLDRDPAWAAEWLGRVRADLPVAAAPTYEFVLGRRAGERAMDRLSGLF
jgi:hypothetical protein